MPAGSWNLGRLRKRVEYVGLKDLGINIVDQSTSADRYFNIVEFPTTLTGGKNLFKLKANANRLVRNSKLHIEVLDSNNKPIYYEPINYLEADGTRVIAIYVYPDTPYGTATVYVAGRARVDLRGRNLRYSQDVNDRDYLNYPNVIWSRTVTLAPERLNSTEIIFTKKPILNLREVVQPYLQPQNLTNVATQSFGTGSFTISPKPTSVSTTAVFNMAQISAKNANVSAPAMQGQGTSASPPAFYGFQVAPNAASLGMSKNSFSNASSTTTVTITATDESVFETDTSFFTTEMSQGDIITITNPGVRPSSLGAALDSTGRLIPRSQDNVDGDSAANMNQTYALSGSYHFVINQVVNTKKAFVVLMSDPAGFRNISDSNTGGKWQVELGKLGGGGQIIESIESSTNYTCSFTLPYVLQITEQSQSFAEIKIADIEPATGDVYKLKTFYKPGGAFGNFIDAGDTILEQLELLEDTGSYEAGAQDGAQYNRTGFFSSLLDYQTYWTSSQGALAPTNELTETFEPDDLMSGIRLQAASNYGTNDFSYIRLKNEYRPNLTRDTQYILTINSFADMSTISTDPNVVNKPQLDIYVSASTGVIQADNLSIDSYVSTAAATYENSLTGNFADNGPFGTRVGSIQLNVSASLIPGIFRFNSTEDVDAVDLYLVQRNGRFNVGNISLKTFNESKFTPNFTRINSRIPTQFLNTPLTFKIIFFDYLNQQAETEALIYPVVFTGENTVIGGNNNLMTGSVFIGNAVGSGIQLAGVNSAFIRSVGYEGFKSASRTDQPGGFMIYTGSVLPNAPDEYAGTGIEIVQDSGSFFRFSTGTDPGLDIKTPKFYFGDESNSISGSNGNIKISGSNVSIDTPTFFLGDASAQISGSNGNIKISGSKLEMISEKFYLGGTDAFVSGANGNIEISSSDFHLNNEGQVIMQGTISATAGGTIGGWSIGSSSLSAGTGDSFALIDASNRKLRFGTKNTLSDANTGAYISTDGIALGASEKLVIKSSGQITGSDVLFDGGVIGGFEVSAGQISASSGVLALKASGQITGSQVLLTGGEIGGFELSATQINSSNDKLILTSDGDISGSLVHFTGGTVGGFSLNSSKITGANIVIDSAGSIQTADYASDLKGWKISADNNGFAEFENAKIRGTLSTAVFEKETVNAVGGQLYIANSTTLTGSALHPSENYTAADATMSVVNVTGFAVGEILSAKKVSNTGFATEYLRVTSASRNDASSDNDFSGNLYVIRGYSGSVAVGNATSSLGGSASPAQSYSGSQVLVSTGKVGSGFIRLNANPNDQATPYMDIVERTGSAIYDVALKARLGDLSGLANSSYVFGNSNPGFGLATDNVFLQGGIIANTGSIGGINMEAGKLYSGIGDQSSSNTPFYLDSTGRFSLKDKLKWDGTNLIIRGQIQLTDGTEVGNGMQWQGTWNSSTSYSINDGVNHLGASYISTAAGANHEPPDDDFWDYLSLSGSDGIIGSNAETLVLTTDSNIFAFDNAADTSATPSTILISVATQNLASAIDESNITITKNGGGNITGLIFSSASSGTGIISASISFSASNSASGVGGEKGFLPLTITATSSSLSDVTTIFKIQGGTNGTPGDSGTNGADAKLLSLESSTLVFVKALDGTITPATASITASLQNMSPATASWTTTPSVTLNTGSLLDLSRMYLTKGHFGTNTSVKVTAASGSDHSDSITFVLLDEGSGNVQAILGNSVHTFQSATDGTVNSFVGGGTTLNVYEGATELTYTASANIPAGQFSASITGLKITPSTFTGDGTTTATLAPPTAMSETSGAIHFTIHGKTQNNTAFTSSLTQSFAKSIAGATGGSGSVAKGVIVNSSTLIFTKDITGIITPTTASFTASLNNATDDGQWSTTAGTLTGPNNGGADNDFTGPPKCEVTRDNFVDGMVITYEMASADNLFADSVTLKLLDAGSGNTQIVLSNQAHTFQADHTGSVTDFVGGGTTFQVFEGATLLTYTASAEPPNGFYSASFIPNNITPGALVGSGLTIGLFNNPTAISATSAELRIEISGSTQNGSSFILPVTQSFVKSLAGSEPIVAVQTNQAHTIVGDTSGTPTSYNGSGTTISVFEGISQLQGIDDGDTLIAGQFKVARSGDNITPGSDSVDGLDVVIGQHDDAIETSGSIIYTITGKSLGGTAFSRSSTQTFTVSTQATDAKSLLVTTDTNAFVFENAADTTTNDIVISVATQNLTASVDHNDVTLSYNGGTITGLIFSSSSLGGTGIMSASLTFSASNAAGGLNGNKNSLPLTISATCDGLTDSTIVHKIEGGTDGNASKTVQMSADSYVIVYDKDGSNPSPASTIILSGSSQNFTNAFFKFTGDGISDDSAFTNGTSANGDSFAFSVPGTHFSVPKTLRVGVSEADQNEIASDTISIFAVKDGQTGDDGINAALLTLEASTLVFVKDIAGNITPASASFTASLQNMSPATASYTTNPVVSLNTGSLLDHTKGTLASNEFGTNTSIKVTAASGSNHSDSITFVLLDEGSGNVQAILGNSSHTFQAKANGDVDSFVGGGTTVRVFEGATPLTYENTAASVIAGQFSASIDVVNITPGIFEADSTPVATLRAPTAMSNTAASGAIHFTVQGFTQNGTPFTQSLTQSFAKSISGEDGTNAKSLTLTTDSNVFAFDTAADSNATPTSIRFTLSAQNLSSDIDTNSIVIKDVDGTVINNPALSSSVESGTGIVTGSITFAGSGNGQLDSDKDKLPVTITITEDGLSDSTTIHKIEGGTAGTSAKLLSLEASSLVFVKAIDGTITPSAIELTASLQNTDSSNGEFITDPVITLVSGSDFNHKLITSANFGTNTSVKVTANGDTGAVSDSLNFVLLDEGSGNILATLGNSSHTFQASANQVVSNFDGGGTSLNVYEGATELTYESTIADVSAGEFSASIDVVNITPGVFSGDGTATAILAKPTAMSNTAASGAIHFTIQGFTQNGTAFTSSLTQSFAKSIGGVDGTNAKTIVVTPDAYFFVKAQDGTYTPSSITISGSGQNLTAIASADGGGFSTNGLGTLSSTVTANAGDFNDNSVKVTSTQFVDGMVVTFTAHGDDGQVSDSVTLKELDAGSGNPQIILGNQAHTFQADHTGSVSDFSGGGTTFQVFEGATVLIYTSSASPPNGFYSASFIPNNITPGALSGNIFSSGTNISGSIGTFANPTAISATSAELRIEVSGSTQNGTSFILPVTQSFVKSLAGSEPITVTQTNQSFTLPGDTSGGATSFDNSGTTISVFEGISQLEGTSVASGLNNGQFEVAPTGDNITPGAESTPGLNVAFADHNSDLETSGSVSYVITGKSLGGTSFTRTITQNFTVTTAATNAKLLSLEASTLVFVKDITGNISPASASFTASLQNTTSTTASYSTSPIVFINTGSSEDHIHGTLAASQFGSDTLIKVTATGDNGDVSDSLSFVLLDEGSGNVQTILGNSSHTIPADENGDNETFDGSGTSLRVFEGATPLTYENTQASLGAGQFSASINPNGVTAGTFDGDTTTTALISNLTAMAAAQTGELRFTVQGFTQNNTPFTQSVTQSFAKSNAGTTGTAAKSVIVTSDTAFFVRAIDGTLSPATASISGSGQNLTQFGSFNESAGLLTNEITSGNSDKNKNTAQITRDNFVDGMVVTFTSDNADGPLSDSVTIKELDAGSGNIQLILSNQAHIFQANHTGSVNDFSGGGTTLQVFEGATALTSHPLAIQLGPTFNGGFYSASFTGSNMIAGALSGQVGTDKITFADPTAISANTAELRISITGSTQNGTAFELFATQSFAKSLAGSEPITLIQTNPAHTFTGDVTGLPTSFIGSGNTISVFEGATQLVGETANDFNTAGDPGTFKVVAVGDNINAGSIDAAATTGIVVGVSDNANETSGSITYTITGKTVGGNDFSRTTIQSFTSTTEALNAKTVTVSPDAYFFIKDIAGNYSPSIITISGSGQNLTTNGVPGWETTAGTLSDPVLSVNSNHVKVSSSDFVDGMKISFTAAAADESVSDSVTLKELDAGSGNIQTVLENQAHTFQANYLGTVNDFGDGGTTIRVFEGVTELNHADINIGSGSMNMSSSAGWWSASISPDKVTPGPLLTTGTIIHMDDLHSQVAVGSRYYLSTAVYNQYDFSETTLTQDFETAVNCAWNTTDADGNDNIAFYDSVVQGDRFIYWISSDRWYEFEITSNFFRNNGGTKFQAEVVYIRSHIIKAETSITTNPGFDVQFIWKKGVHATLSPPTAMSETSGAIHINITGSTQNGTAFNQGVTQSFAKSLAGTEPITAVQSNQTHIFTADPYGVISSTQGSGTVISVFEGATQLSGITANQSPTAGKFKVIPTADNCSISNGVVSGANILVEGHTSFSQDGSGSIALEISGRTGANAVFTRSLSQTWTANIAAQSGSPGTPGATGADNQDFSFLTGSIATIDTSQGILSAGLIMTEEIIGFHGQIAQGATAALSDFTSFLDDEGHFYLGKKTTVPTAYLAWDNTDGSESLLISGSEANIQVDKFFLGGKGQFLSGSNGNIEMSSSFFHLTADGTIKAQAGEIGGFGLTSNAISSSGNELILRSNGQVTASNLLLTGVPGCNAESITIPSGTFGVVESNNWGASAGAQLDLNGDELSFGGYTCPTFHVSSSGAVTHGGLVERTVEIDASNYGLYYSHSISQAFVDNSGNESADVPEVSHTALVLDGSQGGCVISNAILTYNTPSSNGISSIKTLALAGTSRVNLFVNNTGIKFDDTKVEPSMAVLLAKR